MGDYNNSLAYGQKHQEPSTFSLEDEKTKEKEQLKTTGPLQLDMQRQDLLGELSRESEQTTESLQVQEAKAEVTQQATEETKVSLVHRIASGLPVYKPESAAADIPESQFFANKISSLWKANWFGRKSVKRMSTRMGHHIDRFLASSEITDKDVYDVAQTVVKNADLAGYIKEKKATVEDDPKFNQTNVSERLELFNMLSNPEAFNEKTLKDALENHPDYFPFTSNKDIELNSDYFREYPMAAKTILMYRLAKGFSADTIKVKGKTKKAVADRLKSITDNLAPLYQSLINSDDYKKALAKDISQRTINTVKAGFRSDQYEMKGRYKGVIEKELSYRMERLDHAMKNWRHYVDTTPMLRPEDAMENYYYTLKNYEADMVSFLEKPGKASAEEINKVNEHIATLAKLRHYRQLGPEAAEEKAALEKEFNLSVSYKKEKNTFYNALDKQLGEVKKEWTDKEEKKKDAFDESDEELLKIYPREVIDTVRRIDEWVSSNVMKTAYGNSESNFSMNILRRSFSQRLAAYYLIENEKRHQPAVSDVILSQNGYIPDFAKFKKIMKASGMKVHTRIAATVKDTNKVRRSKVLTRATGTTGNVYLAKLEDTLKILDNPELGIGESVDEFEQQKKQAAAPETPNEVKTREAKFVSFMKVLANHQAVMREAEGWSVHTKKRMKRKADSEEAMRKAFLELQAADAAVGALMDDEEFKKKYFKEAPTPESTGMQTANTAFKIVAPLAGGAGTLAEKTTDFSKDRFNFGVWNLSDKQISNTILTSGVFSSVQGAVALAGMITEIVSVSKHFGEGDYTQKAELIAGVVSKAASVAQAAGKAYIMFANHGKILETVTSAAAQGQTKQTISKTVSNMPATQALGAATATVQTLAATTKFITTKVNDSKQEKSAEEAEKEIKKKETTDEAEARRSARLLKALTNTRSIQASANSRIMEQSAYQMASGGLNIIGSVFPPAALVTMGISLAVTIAASIREFYSKMKEKDEAIDNFIGMDKLLADYMSMVPEEARKEMLVSKYGEKKASKMSEDDVLESYRDELRLEVLKRMQFTSYEEMFGDIVNKYVDVMYQFIFYREDGSQIFAEDDDAKPSTDEKATNKLAFSLMGVFAPLKFEYPPKDKPDAIKPTKDVMRNSLMK